MDLFSLPADIFAHILSLTNAQACRKVMCTSKRALKSVLMTSHLIDFPIASFIDSLPMIEGPQNIALRDVSRPHSLSSDEVLDCRVRGFGNIHIQNRGWIVSVICPTCVNRVELWSSGLCLLSLKQDFLRLLQEDCIDLMHWVSPIQNPIGFTPDNWITFDAEGSATITICSCHRSPDVVPEYTPLMFLESEIQPLEFSTSRLMSLMLPRKYNNLLGMTFNDIAVGLVVVSLKQGRPVTDVVKSFAVVLDNHPYCCVRADKVLAGRVQGSNLRDCYLLPFDGKVNLSRVDRPFLAVEVTQPAVDISFHFHYIGKTVMRRKHGTIWKAYAN